ncbi:MAG TPA: ABC transporter ATP-binding protein [Gemmatimonadaceae bacterium]|nr:ABC transporter ATP-binding protein [Gemmatimonadaceae bacterium]
MTATPTMPAIESRAPFVPAERPRIGVELRNVSRWYGNVVAVNDVSFSLGPGITGLLGPNGAGKTTLLHMLAGLLHPSAGEVLVAGVAPSTNREVYRQLALVPERESVHAFLSGYEFVRMCATLQRLPNVDEATERAISLVDMTEPRHRKIGTYSKGMRQRIKIAGALVHEPGLLLLDEPFNGMDPRQRLQMIDMLRALAAAGRVIVISSHILEELDGLATNVLVMVAGRLSASGHYRDIRKLMTDRPHTFVIRSSDDRRLAAALLDDPSVFGIELGSELTVRTSDRGALTRRLARAARDASPAIRLLEIRPTDESLESVFAYLVSR